MLIYEYEQRNRNRKQLTVHRSYRSVHRSSVRLFCVSLCFRDEEIELQKILK